MEYRSDAVPESLHSRNLHFAKDAVRQGISDLPVIEAGFGLPTANCHCQLIAEGQISETESLRLLGLSLNFNHFVSFNNIFFSDIIEVINVEAAILAGISFFHIILETFE
jgi:hypothetical protein